MSPDLLERYGEPAPPDDQDMSGKFGIRFDYLIWWNLG